MSQLDRASCVKVAAQLRRQGKLEEAIATYNVAIGTNPTFSWYHNSLGECLASQGKLDEAIMSYYKAIELNPSLGCFYYNLAEAFYMAGRTLSWQTVVIGDPKSSVVIDNIAVIIKETQEDFKIYPNPFNDQLTISSNKMIYSGQIINLNGALIREFSILENGETELDLSNLKVGTYILKIVGNKKVFQKLILKNH
jgi:tetratricopeptide (TPR) repeat protein